MADKDVVVTPGNQTPTIRRAPDYKVYYANQSRARMSGSDIQVFFGMLVDEPGTTNLFNDEMMSVILAPQHAKLVALAFTAVIQAYESQFGEIKLPEGMQQRADEVRIALLEAARQNLKGPASGKN